MRTMIWIVGLASAGLVLTLVALVVYVRLTPAPPADDPLTILPPASPNWALAAPDDVPIAGAASLPSAPFDQGPEALIDALTQVALAEGGVTRQDSGRDPLRRDFVQRSAIFAFPDIVSARAVALAPGPDGAPRTALVIYSRSVFGYSDLGVNAARVGRWLDAVRGAR